MEPQKSLETLRSQLLRSNQKVSIKFHLNDPIDEIDFKIFENQFGYKMDESIMNFYRQNNGAKLFWRYKLDDREKRGGEFKFINFLWIFGNDWEGITWFKGMEKLEKGAKRFKQFCRSMKVFDSYEESFDGTRCAVFETGKGISNPPIWYWNTEGDKFPLELNFKQYIQRLIQSKAFLNWQYFFIDTDKLEFENKFMTKWVYFLFDDPITWMEEYLKVMPRLFPNDDYTEYELRYQKIKKLFEEKKK